MACKNICKLCDKFVISNTVTFNGAILLIDIPAGSYRDGEKYCILVAQVIPATTTIIAPVYITIGGDTTTLYPLVDKHCAQVTASQIDYRTKYSTKVVTTATGGSFKLLGDLESAQNVAEAIPVATA